MNCRFTYILFILSFLIFGCSKDDDGGTVIPPPPITIDTAYWSFEITVDSTTYAAGDIYKSWDTDNRCSMVNSGSLNMKISDKSDYSYISGEKFDLAIGMVNPQLETGNTSIHGLNTWLGTVLAPQKLGFYIISGVGPIILPDSNGFFLDSIFITSIGTSTIDTNTTGDLPDYIFGDNVEGNASGNIYELESTWLDTASGQVYHEYTLPRGYFSLEFSAIRLY